MRKLHILKTILDIFFILLVVSAIGITILCVLFLFSGENIDLPIKVNGNEYQTLDTGTTIILGFAILAYLTFLYLVFWFRKIVDYFVRLKLFHETIIAGLKRMGICFLLIAAFMNIPVKIYEMINGRISFGFEADLFNSFWFLASMGLFFMVLSNIFKIAKHAKEENELTV